MVSVERRASDRVVFPWKQGSGACLLILLLGSSCATGPRFDAGPLASRDSTPDGSRRFRALGPLVERQVSPDGRTFTAVRPFYSRTVTPSDEHVLQEYLWPVATRQVFRAGTYWRVLTAFGHDFDNTDPESRWRCVVFPFLYMGRDIHGEGYFAVFPLGGSIHEFLGRDTIDFALFPLYMRSTVNDLTSYDVLFPILSKTHSENQDRWRVFPLYGQAEVKDQSTKRFVLWPIWNQASYHYPDGQTGGGFVLFPLFGHTALTGQESWMLIPPFFRYSVNDKGYRSLLCPWPFVQYNGDPRNDSDKLVFWPLWGRRAKGGVDSYFAAWPVVSGESVDRGTYRMRQGRVFPLAYWQSTEKQRAESREQRPEGAGTNGVAADYDALANGITANKLPGRAFTLWPFFSYRREGDAVRFRTLEVWPGKGIPQMERNYSPLFSIYSHVRAGPASEDELLWGLFRRQSDGQGDRHAALFPLFSTRASSKTDMREWSMLGGLAGCRREGLQKTWRLLYLIRFATGEQRPDEKGPAPEMASAGDRKP